MSDVVVVDASLALKWVLAEPDSNTAVMLLNSWTNEGIDVIAPALFTYEVTNTLYRQVVKGKLTWVYWFNDYHPQFIGTDPGLR